MLFPVTMICLAGCLLAVHATGNQRSSLSVGLWVWTLAVILTAAPILDFYVEYSWAADGMLGGALVAITVGYLIVRQKTRAVEAPAFDVERIARWAGWVGLVGCAVLLVDASRSGIDLNPLTFLDRLGDVREDSFERLYSNAEQSMVARLGAVLAPAAYICVIATAKLGRRASRGLAVLAGLDFLLVVAVGFLIFGGRSAPFYAALLALLSWYLAGGRVHLTWRRAILASAVGAAVLFFSVNWIQTRQGGLDFNPERTLSGIARANYHPGIEQSARRSEELGAGLVSLGYFASPIPTFAFYIEQDGGSPGPLWGEYSFPLVVQAKGLATGEPSRPWTEARADVFRPLEGAGYFGNVWATWLRDLVVDFGYLGALMFCALFGAFMAWARNQSERNGRVEYHVLEVIAGFTFAFGAFTSVLPFTFTVVAFFMALALWALRALTFVSQARRRLPTAGAAPARSTP